MTFLIFSFMGSPSVILAGSYFIKWKRKCPVIFIFLVILEIYSTIYFRNQTFHFCFFSRARARVYKKKVL